ncbi:MAG: hypothetical protein P8Z30_20175 [Acidobacteriota bacterium]
MGKNFFSVNLGVARRLLPPVLLSLVALGITFGACTVATEALPGQQHAMPGLSPAAANQFQMKLMELSVVGPSTGGSLKPIVITENEVNSFFKYDRPDFLPPGVKDVDFHFKPEGIYGAADVNFDELKPSQQFGNQLAAKLLASIFTGTQRVTALGAISSSNGTGTLTIKDVHIGKTTLSDWLVNWVIQAYVESEYKVDVGKPFLLPDHVTQIEFAPGKAIFVRGAKRKK